uniref:DUF5050 domain-containing protein n=1 Tax=Strongyloides papillosus TaxID=174720 RepID=A0A0N5C0Y0_STREA
MDQYTTKVCDFKRWENPKAQFINVVVGNKIFFFETKHFEQPSLNWGHFISHRGGEFAIFDSDKKAFVETGKDTLEAIDDNELTEEAIFACDENLYMLLYTKNEGIHFTKLYKWDMSTFSWKSIHSLTGYVHVNDNEYNQQGQVVIAQSCEDNKVHIVASLNGSISLYSIDLQNGTVENLITFHKEKNDLRTIITQAIYHNGIVDCFGGVHGCGFMHFYNKMLRFDVKKNDAKFIDVSDGGLFGINSGNLVFAYYLKDKDCIIVKRGWSNGAGMSRITYDGSIWVLEDLSKEKPGWRRLFNTVPQNGDQGSSYFADVVVANNFLYHGSLESGVYVQILNFDNASKIVRKLTGSFGDSMTDPFALQMNGKLYIFEKECVYNSNMTMPHRVLRKNNKLYVYDLIKNKLESPNGHEIKGIDCDDELFESVFVSQNELYIALFNPYEQVSYEELYIFNANDNKWESIFRKNHNEKREYDVNKFSTMIEIDSVSYGNKYYVVYNNDTYSLYELDISKNEFNQICSSNFEDFHYGKPVSGVTFGDYVYVLYGHHGCGFRWHKENLICFDLVNRNAKIVDVKCTEDQPPFCFAGASGHQLIAYKGYWLQMTGHIQQGMTDSIYTGDVYAVDLINKDEPCWKKIDIQIPNKSDGPQFIYFDEFRHRLIYGNPGVGLFEQLLIITNDSD